MSKYGQVLRQLLPQGSYETALSSVVAEDVDAHAKVFDGVDSAAMAVLDVARAVPTWLVPEYESAYGLPLKCLVGSSFVASMSMDQRIAAINDVREGRRWYTPSGIVALLAQVDVTVLQIVKFIPATCVKPCTQMLNTPLSRFRMNLVLHAATAEGQSIVPCLIHNYLPNALEIRTFFE